MDIDFTIDSIDSTRIEGWAWRPENPEAAMLIEMVALDGRIVARTTADQYRGDLAQAGKRGGWSSFVMAIPADCESGPYQLRAGEAGETVVLIDRWAHAAPQAPQARRSPVDGRLSDSAGATGYLDVIGPTHVSGWIRGDRPFQPVRHLDLVIDGDVVASVAVDRWRSDIEDHNQGDGRVGFHIDLPAGTLDGREHILDLRWTGSAPSLVAEPIIFAAGDRYTPDPSETRSPTGAPPGAPIELSIIVNFYNMHREAERTMISLSRLFQRDIGDLAYEVICIDNGSSPAMTVEAVTRHGPEFRMFRPSRNHPSPVFAINEAAATARGHYLAIMIDGAHLLSPGVVIEAVAALRAEARAMVAVRHWFIGGDQRWLSQIGYGRHHEDLPFAKIGWPYSGYDIFRIASPIFDSPNTWFDSMSESNCLFLRAADFDELGGYEERFEMAGGEFANLDLFSRCSRLADMAVIALIGEATFHQYHSGTTTNVTDSEKERRVRRYETSFETLRGRGYEPVNRSRLKFRGGMHHDFAMNARQRPNSKVRLGLTSAIRGVPLSHALDEGARGYIRSAYVETGSYRASLWAGQPTGVAPADLLEIQQMLWNDRPDVLVLDDVAPGLLCYILSILPAIKLEGLLPIWLTRDDEAPTPPGVRRIVGDPTEPGARARLAHEIGAAERIGVLFQPREDRPLPLNQLRICADIVSVGGHLVVLGAAFGQPGIGYSTQWTSNAIHRLLQSDLRFVVDRTMNAHVVTTCPGGFLLRLADTRPGLPYDEALDALEEFDPA